MAAIEWRTFAAGYCTHPERSIRKGGAWTPCRFPALVFLLHHPVHGRILFDTGYATHFFHATHRFPERLYRMVAPPQLGKDESLVRQLARAGIAADEIGTVVLSHLHGDHAGGLRDFPSARIVCAREGWQDMRSRSRIGALAHGLLQQLLPTDFGERVQWIENAGTCALPPGFEAFGRGYDLWGDGSMVAVALPGHAAGHFGLLFRDVQGKQVFLIADAVWSSRALRDGVPPPGLVTAWLGDTRAYRTTLERLQRLHRDVPSLHMVPSHCTEQLP